MRPFSLPSYAKLNLALEVVRKRADGFHELRTVFERIDLHDDIVLTSAPAGEFSISCNDSRVPCNERNLVWKAARLIMEGEKVRAGARVRISKRIPVAAGLAGGSSNAATALLGLNRLWELGLSRAQLIAYANRLGSDVAFFLHDVPFALGTGRGEIIRPLSYGARLWHFLVVPKAPLLTRDVYSALAAARRGLTPSKGGVNIILRSLKGQDPSGVGVGLSNDLEAPILRLRPHLAKLKARVEKQKVLGVSFSGSGPSVFAVVGGKQDAEQLKKIFCKTYSQVFVSCTK